MSQSPEPVSVVILDKKYQFSCDAEQRNDLIEAARQLDETMTEIKDSGRLMSLERIALQAALIPITNSLFAVGLVALPGMMTGQILSGSVYLKKIWTMQL